MILRKQLSLALLLLGMLVGVGIVAPAANAWSADVLVDTSRCDNPAEPSWFYPRLRDAADTPDDRAPTEWGGGHQGLRMAQIVCWESTFNSWAQNGDHWGLGQLTRANIHARGVSFTCYWEGGCAKYRSFYQLLAALRYAAVRYGSPDAGWAHIRSYGWW